MPAWKTLHGAPAIAVPDSTVRLLAVSPAGGSISPYPRTRNLTRAASGEMAGSPGANDANGSGSPPAFPAPRQARLIGFTSG